MIETLEDEDAPVRTYVDLIKYIENTLGWAWDWNDKRPPWKIRAIEAGKIKKAAQKRKVTVPELVTTVDWMRSQRIPVEAPFGVLYHVERALKEVKDAQTSEPTDTEQAVKDAIQEVEHDPRLTEEERQQWTLRLRRVRGAAAIDAVEEWHER